MNQELSSAWLPATDVKRLAAHCYELLCEDRNKILMEWANKEADEHNRRAGTWWGRLWRRKTCTPYDIVASMRDHRGLCTCDGCCSQVVYGRQFSIAKRLMALADAVLANDPAGRVLVTRDDYASVAMGSGS